MNVTKGDICSRVAKRTGVQTSETKVVFDAVLDEIFTVLSEGKRIEIRGFGAFKIRDRRERMGRNPRTGVAAVIPQLKVPIFKFSKDALKIFGERLINKSPAEIKPKMDVIKTKPEPEMVSAIDRFKV
jgi:nucleoid DNA-binding protein